jgi:hypothetical protein
VLQNYGCDDWRTDEWRHTNRTGVCVYCVCVCVYYVCACVCVCVCVCVYCGCMNDWRTDEWRHNNRTGKDLPLIILRPCITC